MLVFRKKDQGSLMTPSDLVDKVKSLQEGNMHLMDMLTAAHKERDEMERQVSKFLKFKAQVDQGEITITVSIPWTLFAAAATYQVKKFLMDRISSRLSEALDKFEEKLEC